jgi:ubiquitin-protein ligase
MSYLQSLRLTFPLELRILILVLNTRARLPLVELRKRPVDGFSAGLVDDDNLLEWEVLIIGCVSERPNVLWMSLTLDFSLRFRSSPPETL